MFENIQGAATGLLRALAPEAAHKASLKAAQLARFLPSQADDPRLAISLFGLSFPNPVGLAAGYDKDAEAFAPLARFGFGFVECGTVTPLPQKGNPKPRLFRLTEDLAVINRMGFNNEGLEAFAARLAARKGTQIVGANIGANKDAKDRVADYRRGFARLAGLSDYITVNISSPNTPGLRGLQDKDSLRELLSALAEDRARANISIPLLLKIAPDLDMVALDDIAGVLREISIDGLIVSNTTLARPASLKSPHAKEQGGLSGAPLFRPSTEILKQMRKRLGTRLPLVGVGGIASGADAYAKIRGGASLVQLYSALVYEGPGLVARIKRELISLLERDGFANVSEAVGADVD